MAPDPVTAMRETTGVNLSLTTLSTGVAAQAAEPTPTDSTTPDAQTPQAPARAEVPLGPRPSWQQRLIHLHGDGESVKVTIRDSQLDAKEASTVVYRLAGDLAAQGYRLRDAMVNGRHVLRKGRSLGHQTAPLKADASGAQQTVADSAQPIAISPSSTPLQEFEHGA
jgi:hypothetical protein